MGDKEEVEIGWESKGRDKIRPEVDEIRCKSMWNEGVRNCRHMVKQRIGERRE